MRKLYPLEAKVDDGLACGDSCGVVWVWWWVDSKHILDVEPTGFYSSQEFGEALGIVVTTIGSEIGPELKILSFPY